LLKVGVYQMKGSTLQTKEMPDSAMCWALVERIAASSQLKRAARLQELLFYVGKYSLKEGHEKLNEQKIGIEVFGRPQAYDTSADNIVRTSVSELRKRIDAYFESEGADETLVMEIPRWSYVPVFRYRPAKPQIVPEILAESPLPVPEPLIASRNVPAHWSSRILFLSLSAGAVILILAAGCVFFWSKYRSLDRSLYPWQYEPSVAALWNDVLNANPNTDVVVADASFGLLQDINRKSFSFDDYLRRNYVSQLQAQNMSPEMHAAVNRIALWNLGSPDEFKLARRVLALDPLNQRVHLYNARDYMPDLIRRDNVVLIGGSISNPWVQLFESRMNFVTKFDSESPIAVVNRAPAPGEQSIYTQTGSVQYCVVGYLPNPNHNGVVLLIEGTDAEASEAAGDFLLSDDQLSNFKKMLRTEKFPYFEALLKVSSVEGTPLTAAVQAYRAYPNLH
jgi:hypothetical protein